MVDSQSAPSEAPIHKSMMVHWNRRNVAQAVDKCLKEFLDAKREELTEIDPVVVAALDKVEQFILGGGKRLRPVFLWTAFVGAGGLETDEDPWAVLRVASALELIQACALIHDDIIDSSDTRRGMPTIHRVIEREHAAANFRGLSDHYGRSVAILLGDLTLAWADDMVWSAGLSFEAMKRIMKPWALMRTQVISGQILDIAVEAAADERIEEAEKINRFKTATYTVEHPLNLGASLAGADEATISALRTFGIDIGIAYQLRDDMLGVFGKPEVTGKPAGDDLREGKRTVLFGTALELADANDPEAAKALRAGIGTVTEQADIDALAELVAATGAPEKVEQRITALYDQGMAALDSITLKGNAAGVLKELATNSVRRIL